MVNEAFIVSLCEGLNMAYYVERGIINGCINWFCGSWSALRFVFDLVFDATGQKMVESKSHDLKVRLISCLTGSDH